MFTEKITFLLGFLIGKTVFTEAVLEEETFGHTLRATHLPGIDTSRFDDEAYFAAAKLATRLSIPGLFEARLEHDPDFRELVEEYAEAREMKVKLVTAAKIHPVSAEMIEQLNRHDGRLLLAVSSLLEERRSDFRKETLALPDGPPGASKDGLHGGGSAAEEPGGSERDS